MAILFLHSSIYSPVFPGLAAMLKELSEPVTIVLPADMAESEPEVFRLFDSVISIPGSLADFVDSAAVEVEAFRAHRDRPFSRIVATGEYGVLRAARLREALGVPGQSVISALAYRDKVRMKEICESCGIAVPRFRAVEGPSDVLTFVRENGLPIVLKPRAGGGSVDTRLIRTEDDLAAALAKVRAASAGLGMNLVVEKFVDGQLYHVNGYVTPDGRTQLAWPACYVERGNLDVVLDDTLPSGEYILDQDDPRVGRMVSFTERCFEALPRPAHGFAFHLELFEEDESAELVFCEVACRQGGGTINQVYEQAFGLMLLETSVRLQASLPIPSHSTRPRQSVGGLQAPLRRGTIHRASEERPPFGWIVSHEFRLKSGEQATGRRSCVDSSADFVVRGESAMQVLSRLREVNAWHEGITTWTD